MQFSAAVLEEVVFMQELERELIEKQKQEELQSGVDLEKEIESIVKQAQKEKAEATQLFDGSKTIYNRTMGYQIYILWIVN
jgi:hypothetical protein